MKPWTKKYQPKKLSDIAGQTKAVWQTKSFINKFPKTKKTAILLHGQAGVGKTSIVQALASESNTELIELNASDFRNKAGVLSRLEPATQQASLFGGGKIILIDEIDGLAGNKDRGGIAAIINVIKNTKFPIICTANDPYIQKLKTLRKYCELIKLNKVRTSTITKFLKNICKSEKIKYEEKALKKLATAADGDLRAAINDLQMIADQKRNINLQDIILWGREKEENVFNILKLVFKSFDIEQALEAANNFDGDLDTLILWLDENIPKEYKKRSELAESYNYLSRADIFLRRIMRWQHWRFLLYAQVLTVAGVQQSKEGTFPRFVFHKRPQLLLKLYIRAAKLRKMRGLSQQIGDRLHASTKRLMNSFWPYYKYIKEKNPDMAKQLAYSIGL
ncbi:replication factor C large subunit [Candidatus Woesearchaeota archaeon]|nr:replication factor C large subunit [Candidatus Woesearchaeota archaeon]